MYEIIFTTTATLMLYGASLAGCGAAIGFALGWRSGKRGGSFPDDDSALSRLDQLAKDLEEIDQQVQELIQLRQCVERRIQERIGPSESQHGRLVA